MCTPGTPGKHAAPVHLHTVHDWYSRYLDDPSRCSLKSYSGAQSSTVLAFYAYSPPTHLCPVPITFPSDPRINLREEYIQPLPSFVYYHKPLRKLLCKTPALRQEFIIATNQFGNSEATELASGISSCTKSSGLHCSIAASSSIMI
jgi:hypothetical protein